MTLGNVMIFGDSYSTFEGYIPDGYEIYYYTDGRSNGEVRSVGETWWHRVITETDSKLILNDSYSGSAMCHTGYGGVDGSRHSSFVTRLQRYRDSGFFAENELDTVFIFGGTNDTGAESPLGEPKYDAFTDDDLKCVRPAISYLASEIKRLAPKAKVYFLANDEYLKPEIREEFVAAARHFGCDAILFDGIEKAGGHPTTNGMAEIARQVIEYISARI